MKLFALLGFALCSVSTSIVGEWVDPAARWQVVSLTVVISGITGFVLGALGDRVAERAIGRDA